MSDAPDADVTEAIETVKRLLGESSLATPDLGRLYADVDDATVAHARVLAFLERNPQHEAWWRAHRDDPAELRSLAAELADQQTARALRLLADRPPRKERVAPLTRRPAPPYLGVTLTLVAGVAVLAVLGASTARWDAALFGVLALLIIPFAMRGRRRLSLTGDARHLVSALERRSSLAERETSFTQPFAALFHAGREAPLYRMPALQTAASAGSSVLDPVVFRPVTGHEAQFPAAPTAGPPPDRRWERPSARSFWLSLTVREQRALTAAAEHATFSPGEVICREGGPPDKVVIIRSGWTKVSVERADHDRIIALRGPGDLIGERAVLLVRSRSATVTALDTVRTLSMPGEAFAEFLRNHQRILAVVERQIYDQLTEDRTRVVTGDPANVERRLAFPMLELLLRQRGDPDLTATLPLSLGELSGWVGASREGVTEVLASWQTQEVVRISRGRVHVLDMPRLQRICNESWHGSASWAGRNCSILLTDIAGFAALGHGDRSHRDRALLRRTMFELLQRAFEGSAIPWSGCHREDRGDGALVIIPPGDRTARAVDPLIGHLSTALKDHNAGTATPLRLRVALHMGTVVSDPEGVSGQTILHAARLLDAPVLKHHPTSPQNPLALIASADLYDTLIQPTQAHAAYRPVAVPTKTSTTTAYLHHQVTPQ